MGDGWDLKAFRQGVSSRCVIVMAGNGKAIMLTPAGSYKGVAARDGSADAIVGEVGTCAGMLLQAVDARSCEHSRMVTIESRRGQR